MSEHMPEVKRYGLIALVVVLLGGGYYFYARHQATAREEALAQALRVNDATVGNNPQPANLNFATQQELDTAKSKAFTDIASKYHGTQEAGIAPSYMAAGRSDKGNVADAEKIYKDVRDSAPAAYASVAQLALAQLLASENKLPEAEKLLRALMKSPSILVSKEQAAVELGQMLAKSNPAEARKLLEPLRVGRTAVSRAAIS